LAAFLRRSVLCLASVEATIYEARKPCCFLVPGQFHFAGSSLGFMAEEFLIERAMNETRKLDRTNPNFTEFVCLPGRNPYSCEIHTRPFVRLSPLQSSHFD
jgi:hypothetical protein